MPTWLWIVIGIAAFVVLVAIALPVGRRARDRRVAQKRTQAQELRDEAQRRLATAGQREAVAQQQTERARRERGAAEEAARRAADVDPDVPDAPAAPRETGETSGARRA